MTIKNFFFYLDGQFIGSTLSAKTPKVNDKVSIKKRQYTIRNIGCWDETIRAVKITVERDVYENDSEVL